MSYAVVACSACAGPWAVDLRQSASSCPACATKADLRTQRRLWEGESPQEAQQAAAALRLGPGLVQVQALAEPRAKALPRHDSPVDAAAAQGAGIVNRSERANAVALALTRLRGAAGHDELLQALQAAGLDRSRAEAEIVRMLASDLLMEPRAGLYRFLESAVN